MAESAVAESEKGIPFSRGGYLLLSRSQKRSEVWGREGAQRVMLSPIMGSWGGGDVQFQSGSRRWGKG